ncbi:hypothetical protein D3C76_793220 [compost metagenome]
MGSLIYVAVIIIIAIISGLNKAGKNKGSSAPRGGMPTFGGGGGDPLNPGRRAKGKPEYGGNSKDSSGFPVPGGGASYRGRPAASTAAEYDASPPWLEPAESPSPDYETGEGLSLEYAGEEDGVQIRANRMQRELERLQRQFDGTSADSGSTKKGTRTDSVPDNSREFAADRKALRDGLIWAEILGPPRSQQPRAYRRKI